MLIVCPDCTTSYEIDAAKLGAGRSVRCARCASTWFAAAPVSEPAFEASAASDGIEAEPHDGGFPQWTMEAVPKPEPAGETTVLPALTGDTPSLVPFAAEAGQDDAQGAVDPHKDIEQIARRSRIAAERRARRRRLSVNLPFVILVLAAVTAALIGWRTHIVRAAPQSASLYAAIGLPVNLRGLVFKDVRTAEEMHENVPVLLVEGTIVNVAARTVDVPRLRFSVRSEAGIEVYAWSSQPSQPVLGAGEVLAFRSRLASPPADARDVMVRFFHRRDFEGGR
jgi:predicted Zn finger-like uncharacterized protein